MLPDADALLRYERQLVLDGYTAIAGVDEAGRGALAGPVYAAAVLFQQDPVTFIPGVWDSKQLSPQTRQVLLALIQEQALAVGIGEASAQEIDALNIRQASRLAMHRAVQSLHPKPDFVLVDAERLELDCPSQAIISGDRLSFSIAAASIVAKVTRDACLCAMHAEHPEYAWASNKGYPTLAHRTAIAQYGLSAHHRQTFGPCKLKV